MQLRNDLESLNILDDKIHDFYKRYGDRHIRKFMSSQNDGWFYMHYLVDRKHVIRFGVGQDRHVWLGSVALAIGPSYFGAADFWDYQNDERFKMEASTEAFEHNLKLLDEFLGYGGFKYEVQL